MVGSPRREVLLDLPFERLESLLAGLGQPAWRARQLFDWLHLKNAASAQEMTDLPAQLRAELDAQYRTWPLELQRKAVSRDRSIKYGWLTADGHPVEAVLMPGFDYGTAICVSSQSGCAMACGFCQTGYMGLRQYLSSGEILQQMYQAEADSGSAVDRIVFMGMGEPLANLRAVRRVIDVLTGKPGRGWSPRRITVSTVGLTAPIILMARTFPRVNLALSLHFTTAEGRRKHMPQAEAEPQRLAEALYFYRQVNGGKVTIEYTLMRGLNDSEADARRLVRFARLSGLSAGNPSELLLEAQAHDAPPNQQALPLHVNLIAYNPIPAAAHYTPTAERGIDSFARVLRDSGVPVTVRHSRGRDVAAACGQLGAEMLSSGTS